MGYQMASTDRWADTDEVVLHESAARTASGNGPSAELGDRGVLRLLLDVTAATAATGTPTLDVEVQTSYDGATWRALGTFAQQTAVSSERKSFAGCDRFVRVAYTIGGDTPNLTFAVTGEAV